MIDGCVGASIPIPTAADWVIPANVTSVPAGKRLALKPPCAAAYPVIAPIIGLRPNDENNAAPMVAPKIIPALEAGKIAICDRFIDSSLAYQGYARHLGIENVYAINQFAVEGHMPDTTIFLNLNYNDGLKRIETRTFKDRLDLETNTFHHEVSMGYQKVLEKYQHRMKVVDASQEIEKVVEDSLKIVLESIQ